MDCVVDVAQRIEVTEANRDGIVNGWSVSIPMGRVPVICTLGADTLSRDKGGQ